jgi:hypothetical protein
MSLPRRVFAANGYCEHHPHTPEHREYFSTRQHQQVGEPEFETAEFVGIGGLSPGNQTSRSPAKSDLRNAYQLPVSVKETLFSSRAFRQVLFQGKERFCHTEQILYRKQQKREPKTVVPQNVQV